MSSKLGALVLPSGTVLRRLRYGSGTVPVPFLIEVYLVCLTSHSTPLSSFYVLNTS